MTSLTPRPARRWLMVAVLAAATLVACGAATPSPTVAPRPTFDQRSVHAYPGLEERLPAAIAGRAMLRTSYGPAEDAADDALGGALAGEGRDPRLLELATASPSDDLQDLLLVAYRYPGLAGADLLSMLVALAPAGGATPSEMGGKSVTVLEDPEGSAWAYARDDVLYVIAGDGPAAEAAIAALP
ncbi:MAG TPA: hypothetical protein VM451_00305 [Candidatus Limnocylindria bacterium]|nr:hypothetical protein [Candidatus Limnocylindria bacterium]